MISEKNTNDNLEKRKRLQCITVTVKCISDIEVAYRNFYYLYWSLRASCEVVLNNHQAGFLADLATLTLYLKRDGTPNFDFQSMTMPLQIIKAITLSAESKYIRWHVKGLVVSPWVNCIEQVRPVPSPLAWAEISE